MTSRQFLHSATAARNSVRELLQIIFAAELLAPSRCLWIVSPWLRDIPVLDNSTGSFTALCPDWLRTEIRLTSVLRELVLRGTRIVIATRPEDGNRQARDALGDLARSDLLTFHEREALHAKGIAGDRFYLLGSMNLTYNGLYRLTEALVFETERKRVEEFRLTLQKEYGGLA